MRAFVLLLSVVSLLTAQGIPNLFGSRVIQLFFFLGNPVPLVGDTVKVRRTDMSPLLRLTVLLDWQALPRPPNPTPMSPVLLCPVCPAGLGGPGLVFLLHDAQLCSLQC